MTEENPPTAAIQKILEKIENIKIIDVEYRNMIYNLRKFEQEKFPMYVNSFIPYNETIKYFDNYIKNELSNLRYQLCELRGE